ncbi:MAG: hypothetical protein IK077_10325 [Thermoguttaceae bacterium]|nr:hypothetical protein [Thermoguttaceae bacterium]
MSSIRADERGICPLDVAASYLEVVRDDLIGVLRENVENLGERYEQETSPEGRERFWEEIRHAIRGLEGVLSECGEFSETFRRYARKRFDEVWRSLSFNERSAVIGDYKFERFGDENIRRPNFLESRRIAWIQTKQRVERLFGNFSSTEKERLYTRMVDNPDVAFAMCEYVYAIDDYEGSYSTPEVERLLAELTDAIREAVYPSNASTEPKKAAEVPAKEETSSDSDDAGHSDEEPSDEADEDTDTIDDIVQKKPDGYYPVDEREAANAKRAISFDEYVPNSETAVYRNEVNHAREIAERQKKRVDARYCERIDRLLDRFERRLASWYDRRNAAEASCPSILIVGAGNFPTAKHAKKMERLSALYKERDKIFEILNKLEGTGTGGISSDDADALEKLEEKLVRLQEAHEEMKRANAYLRRNGSWDGYDRPDFVKDAVDSSGAPSYFYLSSGAQEIRRIEGRIALLKRQAATDYGDGWKFEGGMAKVNKEENRLQLFFDSVPDAATRQKLKGRGFRWAPGIKAWQRKLTPDAIWAGKFLGYIPKDWKPSVLSEDSSNTEQSTTEQ